MNIPLVILIYSIVAAVVLFAISLYGKIRRQSAAKGSHERKLNLEPAGRASRPVRIKAIDTSTRKRAA